jgi:hypothetical protein
MTTFETVTDPSLINAKTAALLNDEPEAFHIAVDDTVYTLPETFVDLPGGFYDFDTADFVKTAEVRELVGADEEALSRQTSSGKMLATVLERAVVLLGDRKPTKDDFDILLAGDRDTLLLAIYKATYGADVPVTFTCSSCGELVEVEVDLNSDVKTRVLEDDGDRTFTYTSKKGELEITLPSGKVQKEIATAQNKTMSELNTSLIAGTVQSVNGMPVTNGYEFARKLGLQDREAIAVELAKRAIGPSLIGLKKTCPDCEEVVSVDLSLTGLFRF